MQNETTMSILKEAISIVNDRGPTHGDVNKQLEMTAVFWSAYINNTKKKDGGLVDLKPNDIAQLMVLLKITRALFGDVTKTDHYVDQAGYSALAGMLAGVNNCREKAQAQENEQERANNIGSEAVYKVTRPTVPMPKEPLKF